MSTHRRLTLEDRLFIYKQLKENKSAKEIANLLGFSHQAIYYELKKKDVKMMNTILIMQMKQLNNYRNLKVQKI